MCPQSTEAPSAQSGRRDEPRKHYWSPLWPDEIQRAIDKLKPDDFKRFMLIHLVLVEGRATEPPHRSEAAWQRCVGLRGDHWRRFLDRVIAAGVLSVDADGALSGPWARKVYAERSKQTDRNRQNRTSAARQRPASDRLDNGYATSSNFQTPSATEKTHIDQGEGATAVQRPFAKEDRKEEVVERPLNPTGENAGGVECELIDGSAAEEQPQLLMKLRADGKHLEAVERLFGPILVARRFSDRDKLGSLRRLRDSAKVLNGEQLDKAAALVLALQFRTIKPERIAEAIERVRQYGTRVFVDPGTAQWEAWQKFFLVNDPVQAKTMRKYGRWQVSAPWPPGHKPASYEAGQPMEMVA